MQKLLFLSPPLVRGEIKRRFFFSRKGRLKRELIPQKPQKLGLLW